MKPLIGDHGVEIFDFKRDIENGCQVFWRIFGERMKYFEAYFRSDPKKINVAPGLYNNESEIIKYWGANKSRNQSWQKPWNALQKYDTGPKTKLLTLASKRPVGLSYIKSPPGARSHQISDDGHNARATRTRPASAVRSKSTDPPLPASVHPALKNRASMPDMRQSRQAPVSASKEKPQFQARPIAPSHASERPSATDRKPHAVPGSFVKLLARFTNHSQRRPQSARQPPQQAHSFKKGSSGNDRFISRVFHPPKASRQYVHI